MRQSRIDFLAMLADRARPTLAQQDDDARDYRIVLARLKARRSAFAATPAMYVRTWVAADRTQLPID